MGRGSSPLQRGDEESSCLPAGLRGLNNLGNTCFMNSVLQALLHTPPLRNYFLSDRHNRYHCQQKNKVGNVNRVNVAGHHSNNKKNLLLCLACDMDAMFSAVFSGERKPYSPANFLYSTTTGGGPLIVNYVIYVEGKGSVIIEYPGTVSSKILSFVGCHLDIVTADSDECDFDPFSLSIDGDKLEGRGTTDCLGHVALVTQLMLKLAQSQPNLKSTVVAVFIANEETSSILGIDVDELVKHGLLDNLKEGSLYWVDSADKQPCIGTGGKLAWRLGQLASFSIMVYLTRLDGCISCEQILLTH